ncbi:hypothetical protein HK096_003231 [Nowakowskiella sp. JEL0078]|nr:hypothetical protein HK096_003231 [Nowakowskiella sp. JEL0078]
MMTLSEEDNFSLEKCSGLLSKLLDTSLDLDSKYSVILHLKKNIDSFSLLNNPDYLIKIIPAVVKLLSDIPPGFSAANVRQKIRSLLLEFLQRTTHLQPFVPSIAESLLRVIQLDNEENGVISIRLFVDLHKKYLPFVETTVSNYLELIKEMYRVLEQTMHDLFDNDTIPNMPTSSQSSEPISPGEESSSKIIVKALNSFKVLSEVPIVTMQLLSLHQKRPNSNVASHFQQLIPITIEIILLQPTSQIRMHEEARANGTIFVGISPYIPHRVRSQYVEFKQMQAKSTTFIASYAKTWSEFLRAHAPNFAKAFVNLLKDCPPESSAIKRDLLQCARYIWGTDFLRKFFLPYMDELLNEDVLIGPGLTTRESLKSPAHLLFVDFIHHLRSDVTIKQVETIVNLYIRVGHDPQVGMSIQTMAFKLLTNMMEVSVKQDPAFGRVLLFKMISAFVDKFSALSESLPSMIRLHHKKKLQLNSKKDKDMQINSQEYDSFLDVGITQPILISAKFSENSSDTLKEYKTMLKLLIAGIKSALGSLAQLSSLKNDPQDQPNRMARGLSQSEVQYFVRLFRYSLKCFDVYNADCYTVDGFRNEVSDRPQPKEEKEVYELFGTLFVFLEPCVFQEIFASQMSYFFDELFLNPGLISIVNYFVMTTSLSSNFGGLLLRNLVDRMELLGEEGPRSNIILKLFKCLFNAVQAYPKENEAMIKPQLGHIITSCLRLLSQTTNFTNYLNVMRFLFRQIGNGRFEALHVEIHGLLTLLLESLNALIDSSQHTQHRDLFVELCLILPARLTILVPSLSYLMKPVNLALRSSNPELVGHGLRILELCIDNLVQEYLEPILSPVVKDIMEGLWLHLKPSPYNSVHSHQAATILGKLSGRNRRMLKDPHFLNFKQNVDSGIELDLILSESASPRLMSLDVAVEYACKVLRDAVLAGDTDETSAFMNSKNAFNLITSCIPILINVDDGSNNLVHSLQNLVRSVVFQRESDRSDTTEELSPFIKPPMVSRTKKDAHEKSLIMIITALFYAACIPELQYSAVELIENIVRHFAILAIIDWVEWKKSTRNMAILNSLSNKGSLKPYEYLNGVPSTFGFIKGLTDVISRPSTRQFGKQALILLHSCSLVFLGEENHLLINELPIFHVTASQFCSCCYSQDQFTREGGVFGINIFSKTLQMEMNWIVDHELEFIKALVHIIEATPSDAVAVTIPFAKNVLLDVLKICNTLPTQKTSEQKDTELTDVPKQEQSTPFSYPIPADRQARFTSLASFMISELSNSNEHVRETIQSAFQLLSELINLNITYILNPVKDRLLQPIYTKPLRALPLPMLIGHIDAIRYCLELRPPLMEMSDELVRLMVEALALVDAEDQALLGKAAKHKDATTLVTVRVVCIKLLSSTMICFSDFLFTPKQQPTRARIISVFFKSLYANNVEVVEVANKGLQQVLLTQHKLPKDLLQAGLRPILINLSDHKKLTVQGLEGLARLLELLTNYFKTEIGNKLLQHFEKWAEISVLEAASSRPLSEIDEIKIMVAILDVFFLLPSAASCFLDNLVQEVLRVEKILRRSFSSPFRKSLARFLNRYASEAVVYFLDKIADGDNFALKNLFFDILGMKNMAQLRNEITKRMDRVMAVTFEGGTDDSAFDGLRIVKELTIHDSTWILENPTVLEHVRGLWEKILNQNSSGENEEVLCILEILMNYCRQQPSDVQTLFDVVKGFTHRDIYDQCPLKKFIFNHASILTSEQKRQIVIKYVEIFHNSSLSQGLKSVVLKMLVIPVLIISFQNKTASFVDSKLIELIHNRIWHHLLSETADLFISDEFLRMEVIQLTSLLVQHVPNIIDTARKDVIKYAWHNLKYDDITVKQAAYVLLARFVHAFDTPAKIVNQIFVYLLKLQQNEVRALVKQALDILLPALPLRTQQPPSAGGTPSAPYWIRWIKRVLTEDGQNSPAQIVTVYQCMVRHSDLFFETRDQFVPNFVPNLFKFGLNLASPPELKVLSIELVELVHSWELKRVAEFGSGVYQLESFDFTPSPSDREAFVEFVIRLTCSSTENLSNKDSIGMRAASLITNLFVIWPDVEVRFSAFEKICGVEVNEANVNSIENSINILREISSAKKSTWILSHLGEIQKCITKWVQCNIDRITRALTSLVELIYEVIASVATPDLKISQKVDVIDTMETDQDTPTSNLSTQIKAFNDMIDAAIRIGFGENPRPLSVICLVRAAYKYRPEGMESKVDNMVALLQELVRRIPLDSGPTLPQTPNTGIVTTPSTPAITLSTLNGSNVTNSNMSVASSEHQKPEGLIAELLKLVCPFVGQGDSRLVLLQVLLQLIEKSKDTELLLTILELVKSWVVNNQQSLPTVKEKANLLIRMMAFEKLVDRTPMDRYLELVADIYNDPAFARTEYTVRLEQPFLVGTTSTNPILRKRFLQALDRSIGRSVAARINYVLGIQNWEHVAGYFWLKQALDLTLGSVSITESIHLSSSQFRIHPITSFNLVEEKNDNEMNHVSQECETIINKHQQFLRKFQLFDIGSIMEPIRHFIHCDANLTYSLWTELFPMCWNLLNSEKRHHIVNKSLIPLLSKSYHGQQIEHPNVIQGILEGIARCTPIIKLPPQLVQYLGKTFNAWYIAIELLQNADDASFNKNLGKVTGTVTSNKEDEKIREMTLDALTEMYESLGEDDYFYGLWRRRSLFAETNAAISYEQQGMWSQASTMYENAQKRARTGILQFSESEYKLWETHWVACTERLNQWEFLTDLAKNTHDTDLFLECGWRLSDWSSEQEQFKSSLMNLVDIPTPRRKTFELYLCLLNPDPVSGDKKFKDLIEEGVQLTLKKWISLPQYVGNAHIPLLHQFQQFVELDEAEKIRKNLIGTNHGNLDSKAAELKTFLTTWRDRLPNLWDDIILWSDLVAWRHHIFTLINKSYLPLLPALPSTGNSPSSSVANRGHHETAWIINRFAHVARKHQLANVAINLLATIYKLPNIEIHEAFFKLREQAKCYYHNPSEYGSGLDVVNNTNLMYFTASQKADFWTLKGIFLSKLNYHEQAKAAFTEAVKTDMNLANAWASWGQYLDRMFRENPQSINFGMEAMTCYMNASTQFNSAKARKCLIRILWLLGMDDDKQSISKTYESYKNDFPHWYWITFIPQLIQSLSYREGSVTRSILMKLAKSFPQALHFQLRTAKEDLLQQKRQAQMALHRSASENINTPQQSSETKPATNTEDTSASEQIVASTTDENQTPSSQAQGNTPVLSSTALAQSITNGQTPQRPKRYAWDFVEDIMSLLKTAFPLLALSMESMSEQIYSKLKPTTDEDVYRLIVALLNDGFTQLAKNPTDTGALSAQTEMNLSRFAEGMIPNHLKYKAAFERDFILSKPDLPRLVEKFREWRDNLEILLDSKPERQNLENFCHYLVEFDHQKFDEIEVPGQYLQMKDNNKDFIRIERFVPEIEVVRAHGICHRRLKIKGHDGSLHYFIIQHPAGRYCRREERIMQLFRILNEALEKKKETRRRNLTFHLPSIIPIASAVRLVQDDITYKSLQEIYEDYCRGKGIHKDDPIIYHLSRMKDIVQSEDVKKGKMDLPNLKAEILAAISENMIPPNILSRFMAKTMKSYSDLWMIRKNFTGQLAGVTFMTYILCVGQRYPARFHISCQTGNLWSNELVPCK